MATELLPCLKVILMEDKKFLIIDSRPYGFFSIFMHTIDNLKWADDNGYTPVVRWGPGRTDVNKDRPGAEKASRLANPIHVGTDPNFSNTSNVSLREHCLYLDETRASDPSYSCWEHFFEPVSEYSVETAINSEHEVSDIFQVGFHDLNISSIDQKFLIFNLHSYTPLNLWVYCYNKIQTLQTHRQRVFYYIDKYVKVKPSITQKVEAFTKEYFTENVIGVHIRGTDKSTETAIGQRPFVSIEDYIADTAKAIEANPGAALFIASDNNEAIGKMFKHFPDNKIIVYKCTRMSSYSSQTPVHLSEAAGPAIGEEALIDCLLLSKCKHLVCTDSNLAAAALYFNPNSTLSFVNLKGK